MDPMRKIALARLVRRSPLIKVGRRITHLLGPAKLHDLAQESSLMSFNPLDVLSHLFGELAHGFEAEWAQVQVAQAAAFSEHGRKYPDFYEIEAGTALLLYGIVRQTRPSTVVEVGVADGRSTFVILAALDANQHGRLVSVDVKDDVGNSVAGHERWDLRVHDASSRTQLASMLKNLGPIDLYWHDAMHTYEFQASEYLDGLAALGAGGSFVSDDVDHSNAFLDVCRSRSIKPALLMDKHKVVGVFRL